MVIVSHKSMAAGTYIGQGSAQLKELTVPALSEVHFIKDIITTHKSGLNDILVDDSIVSVNTALNKMVTGEITSFIVKDYVGYVQIVYLTNQQGSILQPGEV